MALDSTRRPELAEKVDFYTNHPAIAFIRECRLNANVK